MPAVTLTQDSTNWIDQQGPEHRALTRELIFRMASSEQHSSKSRWLWIGLGALVIVAMTALWRLTPLGEWTSPEKLNEQVSSMLAWPWAPLSLAAIYLLGNALMFPNIALNLAVIVALGSVWGVMAAMAGTLLAGIAAFLIGQKYGQGLVKRLDVNAMNRPLKMVRESGLPGMILLRMLPIAPYPIVNLAVGAGGISTGTFVIGTFVGVLPSLVAMGVIGFQLRQVWESPDPASISILVLVVAAYVVLGWLIKKRLSSRVDAPASA